MPIYEYEREDGSRFDFNQKITDDPIKKCPTTGQKVRKVISKTSDPIFKKGCGGFYDCDYKKRK